MIEIGEYCLDMEAITNSIITLLAAFIIYWLGLRTYYKQKEYENVRSRYLDNGAEVVLSQVDYALGVFRNNWALVLRTTRQYRELESQVSIQDFLEQFREIEQDKFQLGPMYKIRPILNDEVMWVAYQKLFSFVGTTNDKIKTDFLGVLIEIIENPKQADKEGFIKQAEKFAKEIDKESKKFYVLVAVLHDISEMLEKGRYTTKKIYKAYKTDQVKGFINTLNVEFPINDDAQQNAQPDAAKKHKGVSTL